MTLFYRPPRRRRRPAPRPQLPASLTRLKRICYHQHAHVLPVQMVLIGRTVSDQGTPMAVYACPYRRCGWREGHVLDFRSGRPRRLWGNFHRGQ